jgi:outer membrane protein OmpA-like peptidoglycan-associated protein
VKRAAFAVAALLQFGVAQAQEELRFVTCPTYRDTDSGRKSGCWLADEPASGVRYDISPSPTKPDWNFAVLVEGKIAADQTPFCGGVTLDPVRVSVLPQQRCAAALLPAEGFAGRAFALPKRTVAPLYAPRTAAAPPFAPRAFALTFDFGSDFITYQLSDFYLEQAVYYALDSDAPRIEIAGYAQTKPQTVSGVKLAEPKALAMQRAQRAAEWLRLRGVPAARITVSAHTAEGPAPIEAADGLDGPSWRRVKIKVLP